MDLSDVVLLLIAGLLTGAVNSLAGGGTLVGFPALIATGLPPVAANVTNSIAVCPGLVASIAGSRADLVGHRRTVIELLPTAVLGTTAGCAILLLTPARTFEVVVPFLVLGAAGVLGFKARLQRLVGHPHDMGPGRRRVYLHLLAAVGSVYGGYFGAALGVILVAGLALVTDQRMAVVNAMKNVIAAGVALVTAVVFGLFGPVHWLYVLILTPATLAGGYLGARFGRRIPSELLRWIVVAYATAVGFLLLVQAFT